MLSPELRRRAVLLLVIGVLAGCRSTPPRETAAASTPGVAVAAEVAPPFDTTPLPTRNERYTPPAALKLPTEPPVAAPNVAPPPPTTVTALKPRVQLLPPIPDPDVVDSITIPPIVGHPGVMRRSFPDITARPEFGHTPEYTMLTGELSYIPQKNQWRLRYASIDEEDQYGGSFTLDANQQMKDFRSGQLVTVIGEPVDRNSRAPSPLYRVREISLLKR